MSTITRGSTATGRLLWVAPQPISPQPLTPPVTIPVIGRRMWCAWFEFTPAVCPGNADLAVVPQMFLTKGADRIAPYVQGQPDGDVASLERNAAEAQQEFGLPVIGYWTRRAQDGRVPRGVEWVGVEAYRLKDETLPAFEVRVRAAVKRCPLVALICQCYTSNATLTADLASLVPIYAKIAKDCTNVVALLVFSGSGRPTGLQDHPEVLPLWQQLAAGIPGTPPIPIPVPPDPPIPPIPVPPVSTLTLRANNGQYVAAELDGTMNANRDAVGSWERFTVESVDGGKFALKSAHGKYVCAEGGGGGPLIANRTAIGGWEQFKSVPSGIGIALETDNGHFWCAEEGGGGIVNATRTVIGSWETFNGPQPIPPGGGGDASIRVNGKFFARADGTRMTAIETSEFSVFKRYLDNDPTVAQVLQQRQAVGFNLLRVWLLNKSVVAFRNGLEQDMIHPAQDANFYPRLSQFVDLAATFGLCLEITLFTQTETLMPNAADQQRHLDRTADAVRGRPNVLLELVNENDQHDNRVSASLVKPSGVIISHGSNGADQVGVRPVWDYDLYHTNGLSEWQRKVGHNAMENANGVNRPCVSNENTRYPDNESSILHAYDAAAGASLLCAGACFHSQSGKWSRPFDPIELTCAQAWVSGARSVPLEFQAGVYRRHDEMNSATVLRAYSRTLSDGRAHLVKIRA